MSLPTKDCNLLGTGWGGGGERSFVNKPQWNRFHGTSLNLAVISLADDDEIKRKKKKKTEKF